MKNNNKFFNHYITMALMSKINYIIILGAGLLAVMMTGISIHPFTSVLANVNQTTLESVDLHLEECIKELQAGNTTGALKHCELSDQKLDTLLGKATG
jgi:hypothetical protein